MSRHPIFDEAFDLIEMALWLDPEGEGLDLTDREYELEEIVALRDLLSRMRRGIDITNRALAQAWEADYHGQSYETEDEIFYLGKTYHNVFSDDGTAFAEWLKEQPVEKIRQIVKADSVRVTPIGDKDSVIRQTLFDKKATNDDIRIQRRRKR